MKEWSFYGYNYVLSVSIISWFVAQLFKVFLVLIQTKKIDFSRFIGSGGMPSSHSAFVSAMAISVGRQEGFHSPLFAVCSVLGLIVMYDAAGVRRAAGKQATVLNKIIDEFGDSNLKLEERLKELLGHTPFEVIAGAILGMIIGFVL
ncbi:MAG: divergent PAP2 family protein [Epulopiscium sp.]|nr:divergent PAP2 family protein [Candidatus Epulonipiscium sp.]